MAKDADQQEPPSLEEFSDRLDAARGKDDQETQPKRGEGADMGRGLRIASELIAALLVGAGGGWMLDKLFNTAPWALLIGVGLGFAAGLLNVSRAMAEIDRESSQDGDSE